ncbi:unnamed protein product [Lactuca saligna]|uniref:Uncharacterized protein n=1 Tax=Lactuca saligna TaxID=75948 RepID=A0AA36ENI3_LACSI|nr:unnamed protein product [Lactuca saligna]
MGRKKEVVFDEQPPDFDPANPYKDPVAMLEMREHLGSITSRSVVTLSSNTLIQLVVLDGVKMVVIQISTVLRFRAWSDFFLKVSLDCIVVMHVEIGEKTESFHHQFG